MKGESFRCVSHVCRYADEASAAGPRPSCEEATAIAYKFGTVVGVLSVVFRIRMNGLADSLSGALAEGADDVHSRPPPYLEVLRN